MKLSTLFAAAVTAAVLAACGGPKIIPPVEHDPEPQLREDKADMMDRLNRSVEEED